MSAGFPGGPVRTITQTPDGYLWLGTQRGLLRFDGLNFRLNSAPRPSFQNDQISDLMNGPDGKLWVVFWGAGILRYSDGRLEDLAPKFGRPAIQSTASWHNQSGSILLADGVNGIERVREDRTETLAPANALPGYALVSSMSESSDGTIWLGTASQGIFSLRDGHVQTLASGISTRRINCLLPTGKTAMWAGAENGLFELEGTRITRVSLPKEAEGAQILTMLRDRQSNIWLGTSRGLLRVDKRGVWFTDQGSFASGGITALFEDREGKIWAGGARGLERLSEKTFITYTQAEGLPDEINGPVHVDEDGRTWVAPQQGGVDVISEGSIEHVRSPLLDRNVIYSIASHKSDLWMGTQNGGLVHLTYRNGIVGTSIYTRANGLAENSVYSVSIGRDGAVWAGTLTAGVSRLKEGKFVTYTREDGLASNTVSAIVETRDGTMWVATPNGLSSLSDGHWSTYTAREGLASDNVNCLFEDGFGVLWVGTSAGLSVVEHGRIRTLPDLPVSLRDQVLGFAEDRSGRLWVETATRILRVQPERLANGGVKSVDVREYDTADGLPSIEGVRRNSSVTAGQGGQVWFSLRNGVAMLDSGRVPNDSIPVLAHVDMISADNTSIPLGDAVRIPPSPQRITFDYTGVSLTMPERVRFRYFLEGFDHAWSEPVSTRQAVYTNLGPGAYVFRLEASNSDGIWNGSETSLAFRVEPAVWQTSWFRCLVAAAVMFAFWMAYRVRTYQLTRQLNLRFLDRLAERNRIAQDLHDTLLQSFQGMILHFQSVNDMLPSHPDEAKQVLEGSLERADRALAEGRDAIMDIRSTTHADFDLAHAMRLLLSELNEELRFDRKSGNSYSVSVRGAPRDLRLQVRDDVCRIVREAVRNAMQHAMAQQINAEITYSEATLQLRIVDNGKGIGSNILEHGGRARHWGMVGMRERAKRIGATLEVHSTQGKGTEVVLTLPSNIAHDSDKARRRWRSFLSGRSNAIRTESRR